MRVLLAEDHHDNRAMLTLRLERRGHEVVGVANGEEAVAAARSNPPDIVLMDLSMPVMSGLDAIRVLRADPQTKDLKIIVLTAHALESTRRECHDVGCDAFATKPVDLPALLATMNELAAA